ncbi:hypothetical protein QSJ18_17635 [Gordonia sp. ABSL1-1]|uniref:hypothetical protein n=1 Tax=Gordonia sp. ABSL1-1 TaxID=3053923 RepID=UPI0025744BCD|nr:hypothetical protein [Gordonia sp. ABSL1-1]MDL9938571.1 hypothetical protein [Gordonia sp. ABSL1-1]
MPIALISQSAPADDKPAVKAAVAAALADPTVTRLVVHPQIVHPVAPTVEDETDLFFAQVLAVLMTSERLDVEVALVAEQATAGTRRLGLPHGRAASELASHGTAVDVPLIRDDAATVLVGRARHLGVDGHKLHGETYVDNVRLFTGEVRGIRIEPDGDAPGVRARVERPLRAGRWVSGRAAQTGGTNIVVEREGVLNPRVVKRSTYYPHHVDLKLVRA